MFEHLEEIDNGSLRRAHRMSYDGSIWEGVDRGHIYAEEEVVDGEIFYKNLALTKSGKELLRFSKLRLEDIDNAYGKSSYKEWLIKPLIVAVFTALITTPISGIIGFYIGKITTEQAAENSKTNEPQQNPKTKP